MKEIYLAEYKSNNSYKGHSNVNRYHWEVGFKCYKIDYSEERQLGIKINGEEVKDALEIAFFNFKGEVVRRERFASRDEANNVVKNFIKNGFRKVG